MVPVRKHDLTLASGRHSVRIRGQPRSRYQICSTTGKGEERTLPPQEGGSIEPRRILLVEDDPNHRWVMKRILDNAFGEEVAVEEAETGERALERAARKPYPDLVLLDLGLPGIAGLEVLKRIRADREIYWLPVVVLTSSQDRDDVRNAYRHGANSFVSKSDTPELMFQRLRMLPVYWLELNRLPHDAGN